MSYDVARSNGRLVGWAALAAAQTLLNIGAVLFVDIPEDRIYRYANAGQALLQFATMLAIVLVIARPGGMREMLALRRPSSWKGAVVFSAAMTVGMLALLTLSPLLQAGEAQRLASDWDPSRTLPFVMNAVVIVLLSPVVEEIAYRGLGFTLLERFGAPWAIALTALSFGVSHGLVALLPISVAFGVGLALLRSRTRSIYPGIVVHIVFNSLGVAGNTLA